MERMTRNEAASYLGVDAQTITNWVSRGLLGGLNDKESKRFWVNADDVRRYAEKYKLLSVSEELLDKAIKDVKDSERKIDDKMQRMLKEALNITSFSYDYLSDYLCLLFNSVTKSGERTRKIMRRFFDGARICQIADEFYLTRERIRQIVIRGLRAFNAGVVNLMDLQEENSDLKEQVKELQVKLIMQKGGGEENGDDLIPPVIFAQKLYECNLSVRSLNVLRYANIETIGDLVQYNREELLGFRNFGKRSLQELDDFIKSIGLEWGMPKAKVYAMGVQRLQDESYMDGVFRKYLAEIAEEMEQKYSLSPAEAIKRAYGEMESYIERNKLKSNE